MIRKLPVVQVIAGAFVLPWLQREAFLRALAVPGLGIVAIAIGGWLLSDKMDPALGWATWGACTVLWILFAIGCHRVVLLGPRARDVPIFPGWGRRETLFLIWVVVICAASGIAVMALVFVGANTIGRAISMDAFMAGTDAVMGVLATYFFARVALVLPATAIDVPMDLVTAWKRTRGNGLRMFAVVGLLPWGCSYLSQWVGGDEPSVAKIVAVSTLWTAFLAVEVSALSLSYRELAEPDAPVT